MKNGLKLLIALGLYLSYSYGVSSRIAQKAITSTITEVNYVPNPSDTSPKFEEDYSSFKYLAVCSSSASKTYMDWTKTSATSRQGKFMRRYMTVRKGLLYDKDGFIGVALGSYFGTIGDRFIFTLSTGIELKLIKVEEKSDHHTINGCEHKLDHSVIEFVVDVKTNEFPYISNKYIANGNYNNLPQFNGKIVAVRKEAK
jgi:hypothetical protein